jgi:prevent-host-death family protein
MASVPVGIRELRQNLSLYLRRVRAGEHFVVTERNEPVARLVPLVEDEDPVARLIAEGKLKPAEKGDVLELVPIFDEAESRAVMREFREQREERLP